MFQSIDLESAYDKTFIVSGQSPQQRELLSKHPIDTPLYVEGGFTVWGRQKSLVYFILKSDITKHLADYQKRIEEEDDCK